MARTNLRGLDTEQLYLGEQLKPFDARPASDRSTLRRASTAAYRGAAPAAPASAQGGVTPQPGWARAAASAELGVRRLRLRRCVAVGLGRRTCIPSAGAEGTESTHC